MLPAVPAVLALLFAVWSGSFSSGATWSGAVSGHVALLGAVLLAAHAWSDPLRLGSFRRFIPLGLWVAVLTSAALSPVPRAGRVAMILLPAFLLVPAAVERCWSGAAEKRRGLAGLAIAVGLVSTWGLLDRFAFGSPRAAMPLGHHNLLAGFLVALLPLVLLNLRESGSWRALSAAGGILAIAAIVASGSLLAAIALAVQCVLLVLWRVGWHRLLLPTALLVLGLQMPRVAAMISGHDISTQARLVYLEAGWRGFLERPWLGWGPGSVPWTLAEFLRPIPGINPPSEVVGDLHSLPMQILYELGGLGFMFTLGTAAIFLRRRILERATAVDPGALGAGLIGLLGAAVTRLGGASLSVTALPLTVGLAAGCALAGNPRPRSESRPWPVWIYVVVAAVALWPLDLGMLHYEAGLRALVSEGSRALAELGAAHRLDPSQPLYTARLADLTVGAGGAALAGDAATEARSVAALWVAAGDRESRESGETGREAYLHAAKLDPLGALPQFLAMTGAPEAPDAAELSARALLGEPRLLAAKFWNGHEDLRARAVERVRTMSEVDAGWREALIAASAAVPSATAASEWIGLEIDGEPYLAVSLHVFRRQPWFWMLAAVEVDGGLARRITLPAVTRLAIDSER